MNRITALAITLNGALLACSAQTSPNPNPNPDAFAEQAGLAATSAPTQMGVRGTDTNWWFLRNELEHMASGEFWKGDLATTTSTGTDPMPVIKKYADELSALGVRLILVPVPPKAAIYPDKFVPVAMDADQPAAGAIHTGSGFLQELTKLGVEVIDLEPEFSTLRSNSADSVYCAQDSHWSPATCQHTAKILADLIRGEAYVAEAASAFGQPIVRTEGETIDIHGDLLTDAEKAVEPKETLPISHVGTGSESAPTPLTIDKTSPVLVVGDSHTLVFNEGASVGMHDKGAGLVDHLAAELGFPVDREASKGSGADSARANVARRSKGEVDLWETKKVVFWVFSAREFSRGKWRPIPANVD